MQLATVDRNYDLDLTALRYDRSGMGSEVGRGETPLQSLNRLWANANHENWFELELAGDGLCLELGGRLIEGPYLIRLRACPKDWGKEGGSAPCMIIETDDGDVALVPDGWARASTGGFSSYQDVHETVTIASRGYFEPQAPGRILRPSALALV